MRALRERHNLTHDGKEKELRRGDVMLIKGDEKNRGLWKIGIVEQLIPEICCVGVMYSGE